MERKKIVRSLITLGLFVALVAVIIISQNRDPSNPHSTISRETWLSGPQGHGYVVNNNQAPAEQCYPCHEKKGLGGQVYCQSCHDQSGVKVSLPQ
ncbi:hypothetical protein [Desulfitobacterium metallireducens]|uniref:Uncharacterized protein n=1 Tax=Desulfitobacterium metallireducens DSM 15288 TaxID=871968 RepID=W0EDE8_9FIRM|nr:hypothetical protein [Desulfitobacterium metallireducens]AHF07199.1 hypothetical protein DESME_09240 [Desulfitobacterium metallireducens DSM 15288]